MRDPAGPGGRPEGSRPKKDSRRENLAERSVRLHPGGYIHAQSTRIRRDVADAVCHDWNSWGYVTGVCLGRMGLLWGNTGVVRLKPELTRQGSTRRLTRPMAL